MSAATGPDSGVGPPGGEETHPEGAAPSQVELQHVGSGPTVRDEEPDIFHYHDGKPGGKADCCFGCCSKCNTCRYFNKITMAQLLQEVRCGDLILFANPCSIGTCCIRCCTRSDFDHVGIVCHTATQQPAKQKTPPYKLDIDLEGPHLLEALSPHVICDPLLVVVRDVLRSGGSLFYRRLNRPPMEGEPTEFDPKTGTTLPAPIPTVQRRKNDDGSYSRQLTRDYYPRQWYATKNGEKKKKIVYDLLEPSSSKMEAYEAKRKDVVEVELEHMVNRNSSCACVGEIKDEPVKCRQLRKPLNFEEWNQECVKFIGRSYEEDAGTIIGAATHQDSDCWNAACPCCCKLSQAGDSRTEEQKQAAEDSLFCSELAAVLMYKAGWRLGSRCSDAYLPKDFADDAHELLSHDLAPEVSFGPLVEIFLTAEDMQKAEGSGHQKPYAKSEAAGQK